jgi:ribose-phosphate pyrophosphokinase
MNEQNERLTIFSGLSNPELAREICDYLNISMGKAIISKFADEETSVQLEDNIRGNDIYLIQSTCCPANEHIMELLLMVDSCKRASARRINAVIPYYGYARQDRKVQPRVPISAKIIADILEKVGINRIITLDLHADQIQGYFSIPVDHLFAASIFIDYFKGKNLPDLTIVSPDSGGADRARFFATHLRAQLAIIDKRRPRAGESEVMNVIGDIKDRNCIILDDMIDTGGTIVKAAKAVKDSGARSVTAVASHAVLSGSATNKLEESAFEEILFTNSIPLPESKRINKIKILSIASLIGEAIYRIHNEKSVSSLFI